MLPGGPAGWVGWWGAELAQPGLVVVDGVLHEVIGPSFDRLVAFGEGEGQVQVGDPDRSGDDPGDEVVAGSGRSSGCVGPAVDSMVEHGGDVVAPGQGAGLDEVGEGGVDVEAAGFGVAERAANSGPRASLVVIAWSWWSLSPDRLSRVSQRSVWAPAAMVWYSAARVAMLSASWWARRMAS